MGYFKPLIYFSTIFIFFLILIFLSPQKLLAADTDIVLNEVMANAPTPESDYEWIELFNSSLTESIDLNGWMLDAATINDPLAIILPQNYLILARDKVSFQSHWNDMTSPVVEIPMVLGNDSDKVTLKNKNGDYEDEFIWTSNSGESISWERLNPLLTGANNWFLSDTFEGTPGKINSISNLQEPEQPILTAPVEGEKIIPKKAVDFQWESGDNGSKYEIIISQNSDLSDAAIDETNLSTKSYIAEDLDIGIYYWQIIASNAIGDKSSEIGSFEIENLVYSDDIVVNEIFPDPADGAEKEWIELYNNSPVEVDMTDWIIEDLKGSLHAYVIKNGNILPYGYLAIERSVSGITLNNDQDGVRLSNPDQIVVYESPIFSSGEKGWGYARQDSGVWIWTTTPTLLKHNVITMPVVDEPEEEEGESDGDVPVNQEPLVIKTGEYRNHDNYLVRVNGTIVETSGNTFYIDDGSGKAKVYIQDATGIDKPPMHKGDIFEVIGIVNIYRNAWRILPRKQDDIKLIEAAIKSEVAAATTTKKSSTAGAKKTISAGLNTSIKARAPNEDVKKVASSQDTDLKVLAIKSPWWIQLVKVVTAISSVLMIIFVIQIIRYRKAKPLGSDFDET